MSETTEKPSDEQADPNAFQGPRRDRPGDETAPYPEAPTETPETEPKPSTATPAPAPSPTTPPPSTPTTPPKS